MQRSMRIVPAGLVALACVSTTIQAEPVVKTPAELPYMADIKTVAPKAAKTPGRTPVMLPAEAAAVAPGADEEIGVPVAGLSLDRSILYWDQSEGAIHVRAATYKASFAPGEATFIPFLGADAPRNFPITFAVESLTVGGRPVAFDAAAAPARGGEVVSFDHGAFVEQYKVGLRSMEQAFTFDQPVGAGDLELQIAVETEMGRGQSAGGGGGDGRLTLASDLGKVGYTQAIAIDAADRRLALETAWTANGRISIRLPGAFLARAAYPLTIDPVIDTFDVINDEELYLNPDVAYCPTSATYVVSFEEQFSAGDGDVYSMTMESDGTTSLTAAIDESAENWRRPRIAANAANDQALVVAQVGEAPTRIIRGRIRSAASGATLPKFTINGGEGGDKLNPDVGGDPTISTPTHYCVVWERDLSAADHDIHARFVNVDGSLLGLSTIFVDNTGATLDRNPAVSKSCGAAPFDSQRYTIVWQRRFSATDEDIRGAQYLWNGSLVNASFPIDESSDSHITPAVSSIVDLGSERDYMVVYVRSPFDFQTLRGQIMSGDEIQAATNNLSSAGGWSGWNQSLPTVDSNGEGYVVAAAEIINPQSPNSDNLHIASFCRFHDAIQLAEGSDELTFDFFSQTQAQMTAAHGGPNQGREYMTVWRDAADSQAGTLGTIGAGSFVPQSHPNETCSTAMPVNVGTIFDTLRCATNDGASSCTLTNQAADLWYSFTAASQGQLTVSTCGTHDSSPPGPDMGPDTVLTIFDGCGGAVDQVACNDNAAMDGCGPLNNGVLFDSLVTYDMLAGQTVFIRLAHVNGALGTGQFRMHVAFAAQTCMGDLNQDGFVNGIDLGILLNSWSLPAGSPGCGGAPACPADLDVDGDVDGVDLGILLVNFGLPCD